MLVKIETAANGLIVTDAAGAVHVVNGRAELADDERQKAVAQELGELVLELVAAPQPEVTTEPSTETGERARERQAQDEELQPDAARMGGTLEDAIEDTISRHGAKIAQDFLGFLRGVSVHGDPPG